MINRVNLKITHETKTTVYRYLNTAKLRTTVIRYFLEGFVIPSFFILSLKVLGLISRSFDAPSSP